MGHEESPGPIRLIATREVIRWTNPCRPGGIIWDDLDDEKIAAIQVLARQRAAQQNPASRHGSGCLPHGLLIVQGGRRQTRLARHAGHLLHVGFALEEGPVLLHRADLLDDPLHPGRRVGVAPERLVVDAVPWRQCRMDPQLQ